MASGRSGPLVYRHALAGGAARSGPAETVLAHYEAMQQFYSPGPRVARKISGWYMDTCNTPAHLRRAAPTVPAPDATCHLIAEAMHYEPRTRVAA